MYVLKGIIQWEGTISVSLRPYEGVSLLRTFLAGLGLMFTPGSVPLVNLRRRTEEGTRALSALVQGVGYLLGAAARCRRGPENDRRMAGYSLVPSLRQDWSPPSLVR